MKLSPFARLLSVYALLGLASGIHIFPGSNGSLPLCQSYDVTRR